jgi:uncharacterized protein
MSWNIHYLKKIDIKKPILVEGLPGIGNVGKVAVDFLIDGLNAEKIADFTSSTFPHSAFVNEDNLIELPKMELYYKRGESNDLLFLAGDIQPITEESCYDFCRVVLDLFEDANGAEVVTLGGIGMPKEPKTPVVFCTGNNKHVVAKYLAGTTMRNDIYGVVSPVVGVTGVLIGMAQRRNIAGVALLAETYAHPMYLGMRGARALIKVINAKMNLDMNLQELNAEINELENEVKERSKEISKVKNREFMHKVRKRLGKKINYIG